MRPLRAIASCLTAAAVLAACGRPPSAGARDTVDEARTDAYIASLDLERIERLGCDLLSPRYYDPARFGKPLEEVDKAVDYDFARLAEVERRLEGVDRRRVLAHIFAELTAGAGTDTEKHVAVLRFLHRASVHGAAVQPLHPDGAPVLDPLVLLELNEMYCGQAARVACDLFEVAGYRTRAVMFDGHIIAEVFYDGDWHYLDADASGGNGLTVTMPDGSIPSVAELSRQVPLIDALPDRFEPKPGRHPRVGGSVVRSHRLFSEGAKAATGYVVKKRPREAAGRHYGWDEIEVLPRDWEVEVRPRRFQPGTVKLIEVRPADPSAPGSIEIRWKPARDRDHDLLGYRVFVSARSRGWSYAEFAGTPEAKRFWSSDAGWNPEMYDALYTLPPHEIAMIETSEPVARIDLDGKQPVYVTVMPFDEYHERAGKTLYLMSNELRIDSVALAAATESASASKR